MAIALAANHGSTSNNASATTIAHALVGAAAAGTRIVLDVCWFGTQTIASVSGGGLTWVIDVQGTASGDRRVGVVSADCPAGLAAGTTITVTFSAATTDRGLGASSWTGMRTGASGYLGIAPGVVASGAGTAWSTGARTISAGSLLLGVAHEDDAPTSSTPAAGVTELRDVAIAGTPDGWTAGYRIEAAGGSFTVNGTWNASNPQGTSIAYVEYLEATGGGATGTVNSTGGGSTTATGRKGRGGISADTGEPRVTLASRKNAYGSVVATGAGGASVVGISSPFLPAGSASATAGGSTTVAGRKGAARAIADTAWGAPRVIAVKRRFVMVTCTGSGQPAALASKATSGSVLSTGGGITHAAGSTQVGKRSYRTVPAGRISGAAAGRVRGTASGRITRGGGMGRIR